MYDEEHPKPLEVVVVIGTIVGALYAMKKVSESCRRTKLTWKEFLFPKQNEEK